MEKKARKQAAALKYDPTKDDVPVLAAFGEGHMAEKIIEQAESHHVPVVEDKNLASMLSKLSVGDNIPPQLYEVVARILVFVGETDRYYGALKNRR
jgi:flagellar biosynthesis protein